MIGFWSTWYWCQFRPAVFKGLEYLRLQLRVWFGLRKRKMTGREWRQWNQATTKPRTREELAAPTPKPKPEKQTPNRMDLSTVRAVNSKIREKHDLKIQSFAASSWEEFQEQYQKLDLKKIDPTT